jgi:hypothetical protein
MANGLDTCADAEYLSRVEHVARHKKEQAMQSIYDIGTIERVPADSPARNRTITAPRHGRKANRWCGMGAVSAITGCTTDLPALIIAKMRFCNDITPRDIARVKGTYTHEVAHALRVLGFETTRIRQYDGQTFAKVCDDRKRDPNTAYLVAAALHWMVVQGKYFADNQLGLLRCDEAHKRRGIVNDVHIVRRVRIVNDAAVLKFLRA